MLYGSHLLETLRATFMKGIIDLISGDTEAFSTFDLVQGQSVEPSVASPQPPVANPETFKALASKKPPIANTAIDGDKTAKAMSGLAGRKARRRRRMSDDCYR